MDPDIKRRTAETLISNLSSVSDQTRISSLCELRLLTKSDPDIRPIITQLQSGAAISLLAESLYSSSKLVQENASTTLLNLSISCKNSIFSNRSVLDSIAYILSNHRTASPLAVQSGCATIYSFTVEESYRPVIGSKRDIVYSLIDIVGFSGSPSRSIKDGLKALFGLSLCSSNLPLLVEFKAVESLFGVVMRDRRVGVIEDVTAVIAQICGCESDESVQVFRKCSGIRVMVDMINPETGSSSRIKENVISGLLRLVKVGGEEVGEDIREVGLGLVFDWLGEVVENGSEKGKKRAEALIKVLEDGMSNANYSSSDLYSGPPSLDLSNSNSYLC